MSTVTFAHLGLTFVAEVDYAPYVPGRFSGPPEDCYPDEGGFAEITGLTCEGKDAMFLMQSDIADDLSDVAYQSCRDDIKSQREQAQQDRAADRAYDRRGY